MAIKTDGQTPSKASLKALDWTNFFLADIRDGLGPYVEIVYPKMNDSFTATHP